MILKEMFYQKYLNALKTMNKVSWENAKYYASAKKMHLAHYMYMCLEITENDIRENGGYAGELWQEIKEAHENKLLASNKHRQEHGHVDKYWLTPKGFKIINKDHSVC